MRLKFILLLLGAALAVSADYEFKNFPELIYISYIESVKDDELEKEYKEKKRR